MPENESLVCDARTASRWRPIRERLDCGQSPSDLFPEIQDQFYREFKKSWKRWEKRWNVDPVKLLDSALSDQHVWNDLIKHVQFDGDARLLREVAVGIRGSDRECLLSGFLNAVWETVECELQLHRRDNRPSLEFNEKVQWMLKRIACGLVRDPTRFPKRPALKSPPPDLDTRLGESLL